MGFMFSIVMLLLTLCCFIAVQHVYEIKRNLTAFVILVLHTEKTFRNCIESNRNFIVFTIFRLIWNQTDVRLVLNRLENGRYNPILVSFYKISKRFLCVYYERNCLCYTFILSSIVYTFTSALLTRFKVRVH